MNCRDSASSPITGIILMIALTILLAALVLLMALQFADIAPCQDIPDFLKISRVTYTLSADGVNYVGIVVIMNTGDENLRNRFLKVKTYVNDQPADCRVPTLNNDLFCSSDHSGVARLHGVGTWGNRNSPLAVWSADDSEISIEYEKGKVEPGDRVTLEFIDTRTGQLVSRDTYPHSDVHDVQWFYNFFLNRQGA